MEAASLKRDTPFFDDKSPSHNIISLFYKFKRPEVLLRPALSNGPKARDIAHLRGSPDASPALSKSPKVRDITHLAEIARRTHGLPCCACGKGIRCFCIR